MSCPALDSSEGIVEKKPYSTPKLEVQGAVNDITLGQIKGFGPSDGFALSFERQDLPPVS